MQLHVLPVADSDEGGWVTGETSHTLIRLKRTLRFPFSVVENVCFGYFKAKYDIEYEYILSKLQCLYKYIWCACCSLLAPMKIVKSLWAILKVASGTKANTSYIVWVLTKILIYRKRFVLFEGHFIVLYNSPLKPRCSYP